MVPDQGIAGFVQTESAPAKINLALHVVGQRADGYHLLDMLVTFTRFGDRIGIASGDVDQFTVSGRFAQQLDASGAAEDNLVLRARDLLRAALRRNGVSTGPAHLHLEKNLPVASGIGGGSADAAATLRGLLRHWQASLPANELNDLGLQLGADVPMCLAGRPLIARGIGEEITQLEELPAFPIVLVNPLVGVSTPDIFRRLATKDNPSLGLRGAVTGRSGWLAALEGMRNDLEDPARTVCPQIDAARAELARTDAQLVRMSGSGATCFGLYETIDAAQRAAEALKKSRPDWFIVATESYEGRDHHGTA
ncbi:4-(cytidine 5'-diphospho)-2-C-methyl-D-erythritol kinase [Rhizobium sp. ARZ01]|uniref:4-(cytidine 5'-diphospho)-2-C-methyl-D-erythritol kinase n=1 Tax=Rhizobium sp. ARZ01 TaxID=2769313 RepID=UPI0017821D50|nr:4-(cytidine 5'-diphospho)-2-C-methyl-D-erythritol kinase [Rhizobium sp. ARZ01]MBD9371243.1 4-(cytidine 5'-diphospho)-2-C-methyl-D-erythritol kinase [Rhizobium sp. ARZ01]